MVTVAMLESQKYVVDTGKHIGMKGLINGNWGEFFVVWLYTTTANIYPGAPVIRGALGAAADADKITEPAGNAESCFGVPEFDPDQLATAATKYASGDLAPVLPFAQNPGMIFQGWVLDTNGNKIPDTQYDAGAAGFDVADYANKSYAGQWNYVADTGAVAQHLILYVLTGGHGG
jgi:hypothetical protein